MELSPAEGEGPAVDNRTYRQKVRDAMMTLSSHEICAGLPREFADLYDFVNASDRLEVPDYETLHAWFDQLWDRRNWGSDDVFSWTDRLFHEELRNLDLQTSDIQGLEGAQR